MEKRTYGGKCIADNPSLSALCGRTYGVGGNTFDAGLYEHDKASHATKTGGVMLGGMHGWCADCVDLYETGNGKRGTDGGSCGVCLWLHGHKAAAAEARNTCERLGIA